MTPHPDHRRGVPHYLQPRWMAGHFAVLALCVLFLRLGWWQILSALDGRVLSIGYALQWPAFAGFGVFLWIRTVRLHRTEHGPERGAGPPRAAAPGPLEWTFDRTGPPAAPPHPMSEQAEAPADCDDPDLRDYQNMLDWLHADPRRHPYQYRRRKAAERKET